MTHLFGTVVKAPNCIRILPQTTPEDQNGCFRTHKRLPFKFPDLKALLRNASPASATGVTSPARTLTPSPSRSTGYSTSSTKIRRYCTSQIAAYISLCYSREILFRFGTRMSVQTWSLAASATAVTRTSLMSLTEQTTGNKYICEKISFITEIILFTDSDQEQPLLLPMMRTSTQIMTLMRTVRATPMMTISRSRLIPSPPRCQSLRGVFQWKMKIFYRVLFNDYLCSRSTHFLAIKINSDEIKTVFPTRVF